MTHGPDTLDAPSVEFGAADIHPAVQFHEGLADRWFANYSRPSFGERAKFLLELIDRFNPAPGEWLDAGCGSGVLSLGLAARGHHVTGVDASPKMLESARSEAERTGDDARTSFHQIESVESLPSDEESFDGVLCSSVIEYLDTPRECLSELVRVLRPGGVAVISVPNRLGLLRCFQKCTHYVTKSAGRDPWPSYIGHSKNDFTKSVFLKHIKSFPLEIVATEYYGACLPSWLSRQPLAGSIIIVVARKLGGSQVKRRDTRRAA